MLITRRVISMDQGALVWSTQEPEGPSTPLRCGRLCCPHNPRPWLSKGLKTRFSNPSMWGYSQDHPQAPPGRIYGRSPSWPGGNAKRCLHAPATRSVAMQARVKRCECARMGARCRTAFKGVVDPARRGYSSLPPLSPLWGRFENRLGGPVRLLGEAHAPMKSQPEGVAIDKSIFWLLWLFIDPLREIKKRTPEIS